MKLTKRFANSLIAFTALITTLAVGSSLHAQTVPGKAKVTEVKGPAFYAATPGAPMQPLSKELELGPGATVKTGAGATVVLFLGYSAGEVIVTENTVLALDKLAITDTGADRVVEVQLNVPEGTILGDVDKLAAASKYEIKVPNGVAGIRGTQFRISATGYIVLLQGTLVFVYVAPGGNPAPYTLNAPPPVYFSPIEGIKPAPQDLVQEVERQFRLGRRGHAQGPPEQFPGKAPFIPPGIGASTPFPPSR